MGRPLAAVAAGIVTLAFTSLAIAQPEIQVETRAGVAFARITGDIVESHQKQGFAGGFAVHVPLAGPFSFQPEFQYVSKGNSYGVLMDPVISGMVHPGAYNEMYSLDYFEMPLLLRATFGGAAFRPAISGGGYAAYKVLEKYQLNGPGRNDPYESTDLGRKFDLGYVAAGALELGPRERCLTLEARYTASLVDIQRSEYACNYGNLDFRFQIGWKQNWPSMGLQP